MCGFCGFTGDTNDNVTVIKEMMNKIIHRGPDSEGIFSDENCTLGFRRLSIIDLEEGGQPLYNEDDSLVLVFNGEIYNYKALRETLIEKGHVFKTHTDSEVLLHLYEEYNDKMLSYLRGMFSFVIFDKKDNSLFAARDFFGIKPFYYSNVNGNLVFGSEIKSFFPYPNFPKKVNDVALENYLTFQYSVLEETFFKDVFKLMPGHFLKFKDGQVKVEKYWDVEFKAVELSLENTVNAIDKVIDDTVKYHKVSDVEVGSFLSSGVDSSFIAAKFKGDKTFTVGFDYEKYNEIDYAKALSEKVGIDNYSKIITTEEYWDVLPKLQYHMDEPLADPSAVALYFVSNLASEHVKVSLSGEGADEFFGGYNIYKEPLDLSIITDLPMPVRKFLGKFAELIPFKIKGKNFLLRGSKTVEERFIGNAKIFTKEEREKILLKFDPDNFPQNITKKYYDRVTDYDDITKMQYLDIHLWMVGDILLKADKMSMANSLEVRVPYLDKEVFKVASRIPTKFRVNKTGTKYAFRKAALSHLPEEVAQKKKLGFPVPIRIWLKEEKYFNIVKEAFLSEVSKKYFDTNNLVALLEEHRADKADNSRKIWTVYTFLLWHNQFFSLDEVI